LAIINEGKIVYTKVKGYADMRSKEKVTDNSIFEGASLSKPLFAYFVMMYVEEGLLALDTPLFSYLPYEDIADDERYKKITARMVLSHTSGFPNWRSNGKLTINHDPGSTFEYSGEGYQYLAKVLAKLLNTDDAGLEAKYQEKIARPFDLQYTKYLQDTYNISHKVEAHREGEWIKGEGISKEFGSAYSIHTNARDYAKWLLVLLEEKGLKKESFEELFTPQSQIPEDSPQRQIGVTDWTLGFAKVAFPFGTVFAHGGNNPGYSSIFAINREKKWGIVLFSNADQSLIVLHLMNYLHREK